MLPVHAPHQGLGDGLGDAGEQADGDQTAQLARHGPDLRPGAFQLAERPPRVLQQHLSVARQLHPLPPAFEQGRAELLLEEPDLPRDRGLDQVQDLSRSGHAAGLCHGDQRRQLPDVHDPSPPAADGACRELMVPCGDSIRQPLLSLLMMTCDGPSREGRMLARNSRVLARLLPDAIVVIPGGGHFMLFDRTAETVAVVADFLTSATAT
jgi:pimeloyl-ACP methyl ester carboxylesterase